jgi:hypothetical protein
MASSREIGFRVIAKLVGTVLVLPKTPKPDGSECQRSPFLSGISLSGNRHIRCRGSLAPQISEPRTPMRTCALSLPRHLLSLFSIGNRVIAISKVAIPLHWKIPNVEPRFSGLQTRVQLGIHGPNLFGKSQIAISTSIKSPTPRNPDIPMS